MLYSVKSNYIFAWYIPYSVKSDYIFACYMLYSVKSNCHKCFHCCLQLPDNRSLTLPLGVLESFFCENVIETYTTETLTTKLLYMETVDFEVSKYNQILKIRDLKVLPNRLIALNLLST